MLAQSRLRASPRYRVIAEHGPDHSKVFEVELELKGEVIGKGAGRSKKDAEQAAAKLALEAMNGRLAEVKRPQEVAPPVSESAPPPEPPVAIPEAAPEPPAQPGTEGEGAAEAVEPDPRPASRRKPRQKARATSTGARASRAGSRSVAPSRRRPRKSAKK